MKPTEDFVLLLHPRTNTELDLTKDLLGAAKIPYVVDSSDRFEMLEVLEGQSAEGARCVLVPKSRLDDAVGVLQDAWGPEAFAGRDPRGTAE